jgi:hypothetical protein
VEFVEANELERILIEDGWSIAAHEYSSGERPDRSCVLSLTAPTGARFDADGRTRKDALQSAALLAGLVEPEGAHSD